MTTRVTIRNEGPGIILATARNHTVEPRLVESALIVKPDGEMELHVYDEQSIFIRELP